jgi:hypothetical protein
MNQHRLIDFFYFDGTDDRGRTLAQILCKPDEWLECTHDFIQWLFPLKEKSGANLSAPLIDYELEFAFERYDAGRKHMLKALDRMLKFYGLQRQETIISKGDNWALRKGYWFTEPTHNNLRITRMLKSLSALGCGEVALTLLNLLQSLKSEPDSGISDEAIGYWKSAVGNTPYPRLSNMSRYSHMRVFSSSKEGAIDIVNSVSEPITSTVSPTYKPSPNLQKLIGFADEMHRRQNSVIEYFDRHQR